MRTRITAFLGIALLILVISSLSTSTVFAAGATKHRAAVVLKDTTTKVGEATMVINNGKITVQIRTTGLTAGHVYSVWGAFSGQGAFNLTGGMASGNGTGNFTGHVNSDLDPDGFKVTLKNHGAPEPGKVPGQKTTKDVNCPPQLPFGANRHVRHRLRSNKASGRCCPSHP